MAAVALNLSRPPDELVDRFRALYTRNDVADLFEISSSHLNYVLYRGRQAYPYRLFKIPKKTGGSRSISAPSGSILILQSKLLSVLRLIYRPKPSVHGFVEDRSILSNALQHSGKRFVLNVDLTDFPPSINYGRVRGMLMAEPYSLGEQAASALALLCTNENALPQGAPTSPILSNMICSRMDGELLRLAAEAKCYYTRYADDLTFSTSAPKFPEALASVHKEAGTETATPGDALSQIIRSNAFEINEKKLRLQYKACHQEVTGLTVNKFPNVRRRFVRQLRAMLHAWRKHGYDAAQSEYLQRYDIAEARNPEHQRVEFSHVVQGKLAFLKMVKGESDQAYRKLAGQLHSLDPSLIAEPKPEEPAPRPPAVPALGVVSKILPRDIAWDTWYEKYKHLVFQTVTVTAEGNYSGGTAFFWGKDILATASHNTHGEIHVSPPMQSGSAVQNHSSHPLARKGADVALLSLPADTIQTYRIPVRPELPGPGEQVAALGFPAIPGREPALGIYPGHVESVAPTYGGEVLTIQVSAELSGGLSGGPVIDRAGRLVGVVMETTFEDTGQAVPARAFRHVVPTSYLMELGPQTHSGAPFSQPDDATRLPKTASPKFPDAMQFRRDQDRFDVFLSYNSKDKASVKEIALQLIQQGILPWLDEWELRPGVAWQDALEKQLAAVPAAAVLVGPSGIGSWQDFELQALLQQFVRRGGRVIPTLLPGLDATPDLPLFLSKFKWVDFGKTEPDPLQQLVWGITGQEPVA